MALTFSVFIKLVFCFLTYVESFIFPSQSIEQEMPIDLPQFQLILIQDLPYPQRHSQESSKSKET